MITVFTPTYNRAYRLPVLYRSLLCQTDHNFEWLIVDDGSQDDTRDLISSWIAESPGFPIRYFYQENSGKHCAVNLGVIHAKSEWFFIVDSDDYLLEDAVEKIHQWISTVDSEEIAAVSGTKYFPDRCIIGSCQVMADGYLDAANNERRKYGLLGDKAEVYRTKILKEFPFPVFPGERFIPEGAVWDAIALAGYKIRWFNHPTMICEYLDDGLSAQLQRSDIEIRNFEGCTYYTNVELRAYQGLEKVRIICQYINKGRKKGLSATEIANRIQIARWTVNVLTVPVCIKNAGRYICCRVSNKK